MESVTYVSGNLRSEAIDISVRRVRRANAGRSPERRAYRNANRPFRRAFGRGERWRQTLLACGEARARELGR